MNYAERFFLMAVADLAGAPNMAQICAPLANSEFSGLLEPFFLNGTIQDRLDELSTYAYGGEVPGWYKHGCKSIATRLGGIDPFPEE